MVASYHMKNSSPTMLPQRAMSLVPFQVQMPPDQALFSQVASIVDRLPVDRRLHTMQEVPAMTHMLQHSVMQQQQQIQQQPQQQTVLNMTLQFTSKFIGFSVKSLFHLLYLSTSTMECLEISRMQILEICRFIILEISRHCIVEVDE